MMNDARVGRSAAGPPAIKREAFWTSLVAMGLAVATTAIAQNEPSDKDEREPSWIVEESVEVIEPKPGYEVVASESALRMVTPLLETPRSVQVLNRTLIEEQELQNLTDALVNVSGVAPSAREELVLVSPIVRGFAADLFVDGLSAFALTAVADPTSMVNVEKVEVLKGPSGMLFSGGAGVALGGVINVVTRAPKSQLSGSAGLRVGEFETFGALFDVSVPLPAEAWSLRFNGDAESADSHLDEVDYERLTFNGALVGAPTDRSALRLRAQSSDVEQLEYAGLPASITLGGSFGVDPFRFSGASDAPPTTVENQLFTASWEQRLGSSFALTLEGRRYSSDFEEFASFPFFAFFPPSPESPTVFALIRGQLPTQVDQDMISPRVEWSPQGSSESVVRHRVLAGIEVDRTDYTVGSGFDFFPIGFLDYADSDADLSFGSVPQITGTSNQTYGTDALYVQDQISIGSRVDLLL
ncbi:MAG: TonB-dependent receptor plug domain-containing protein, partial [Acidobacteriota bacterium]